MRKSKEFLENAQGELLKQYRQEHSKYVHYQLALCVAAIGFSVSLSLELNLSVYQIPMGLAVLSWAISIILGFKAISNEIDIITTNFEHFNIILNTKPEILTEEEIDKGDLEHKQKLIKLSTKSPKIKKGQQGFFYAGIAFFIVWCVFKMSLN